MSDIPDDLSQEELDELQRYLGKAPMPEEKATIAHLFLKALKLKKSTKVAFFDKEDIRRDRILLDASNFAKVFEQDLVSQYFADQAETIASSSMGKTGFFLRTSVTTRKDVKLKDESGGQQSKWYKKNVDNTQQQGDQV